MRKVHVGDFKIDKEEKKVIMDVLESGKISEGKKVKEFEKEFAKFIGTKYCIAVNSGSSALICGLESIQLIDKFNIGEKTKVITTPLTYIATSSAIVQSGLYPVYVDIDPKTFNITPENIKQFLENIDDTSEYSMILPVHLMGYVADMDEINKIAKEYGLQTFEDSAQAHGSIYKRKKAGSLSLASDFSFYIAHNIQAGEMGAITTNDFEVYEMANKIKAQGRMCDCYICTRSEGICPYKNFSKEEDFDPRFYHTYIGYNFKTMEFQAALALIQLKRAEWIIKRRQEHVEYLNENLEEYQDIFQLPEYSNEVSYLAYPIIIKNPEIISRGKLRLELEKEGIETRPLFGCIPTQQPAFQYLRKEYENKLPNAEYIGRNGFYIGCHQYLEREDLDHIIERFKSIMDNL